jgi:hypothetical protein
MNDHLDWARREFAELALSDPDFLDELVKKNVDYVRGLLILSSLFVCFALVFLAFVILDVTIPFVGIQLPGWAGSSIAPLFGMFISYRILSMEDRLIRRSIRKEISATLAI